MKMSVGSIFSVFALLMILLSGCTSTSTSDVNEQVEDTKSNTVSISSDGSGDFATLDEAIEAAPPNSIIVLGEGQFDLSESHLIEKSLTIQGAGSNLTTISKSSGGSPIILFKGEKLIVRGISIKRAGEFASDIMTINGGEADFEDCNISGGATSEDKTIQGVGLVIRGSSNVTMKNCIIENNAGFGIVVTDNAKLTVDQIKSVNNQIGIVFAKNSIGDVQNSIFSDNIDYGIFVIGLVQVNIEGNTIVKNGTGGIYFELEAANGEVRDNKLAENDLGDSGTDIKIMEVYSPALIGNTCDGKGKSRLGGDLNGIVFMGRKSTPTDPILEGNSCMVARCTTPTGSFLSLECK